MTYSIYFFSLSIILLSAIWICGEKVTNRIAEKSQIDICATRFMQDKENFFSHIKSTNQRINTLKWIVYAARGVKFIPVAGAIAGSISETAALTMSKFLAGEQELRVEAQSLAELAKLNCPKTPFLKKSAACLFVPTNRQDFIREKTIFPDVPGALLWAGMENLTVECLSQSFPPQISRLSMSIINNLQTREYVYQK